MIPVLVVPFSIEALHPSTLPRQATLRLASPALLAANVKRA